MRRIVDTKVWDFKRPQEFINDLGKPLKAGQYGFSNLGTSSLQKLLSIVMRLWKMILTPANKSDKEKAVPLNLPKSTPHK